MSPMSDTTPTPPARPFRAPLPGGAPLLRPGLGALAFAAFCVAALPAAVGCSGLDAGVTYPSDLPDIGGQLITPENKPDPSFGFVGFKISPKACEGLDTHAMTQALNQDDFTRFLETQGFKLEPKKARSDLYWYEFPNGRGEKSFVRLRLAILGDQPAAAKDLHASLLEHGPGWWGVRRSNVAILAPKASFHEAVAFAIKYKLVCWGQLTYAGNDDAYVVPGPYAEF
jgi:hypothetical protein